MGDASAETQYGMGLWLVHACSKTSESVSMALF